MADQINYAPGSDNMVALLTSQGVNPATYGSGVFGMNGPQVLRLSLIPEPTSIGLIALGGLLLLRRRKG